MANIHRARRTEGEGKRCILTSELDKTSLTKKQGQRTVKGTTACLICKNVKQPTVRDAIRS